MVTKIVHNEKEFSDWFEKNYKKINYEKILKNNKGKYPDFVMQKKGKKILVELETLSSNFILHKHNPKKVDEVLCIKEDIKLNVKTIIIKDLKYKSKIVRISATVDESTINIIKDLSKKGKYRNKSHIIEEAIKLLNKKKK